MKSWLKGIGSKIVDAGKAKIDEEKRRLDEPPLNPSEKELFERFTAIKSYIPAQILEKLPPAPEAQSFRNRPEIRALVSVHALPAIIDQGEQAKAIAEQEEKARQLAAAKAAADERARARAESLAKIDAFYDNELNVVEVRLQKAAELGRADLRQLRSEFIEEATGEKSYQGSSLNSMVFDASFNAVYGKRFDAGLEESRLSRTLRDFPVGHRAILRLSEILGVMGHLSIADVYSVQLSLIWNDGKTNLTVPATISKPKENSAFRKVMTRMIETRFGSPEAASELVQSKCRTVLEGTGDSDEKAVLNRYLYSGTRWLTSDGIKPLIPGGVTDKALRLGAFADGEELFYDRNESLITIAPPGTGKSTAHVMRNLLYLNGPAVVLDIKGDMYAATAEWRKNVGKVYRFAPNDRENSLHFNPLDFIPTDPDEAYEESERLAELLTVPAEEGEYFDERAIQVIRAMVLYVALTRTGAERCMETVIDLLSGVNNDPLAAERAGQTGEDDAPFNALISDLMMHEMPTLRRMGSSLNKMPAKQREGVFDTARTKLKVWESPAIARLTRSTTFRPEFLRGERASLYLCIDLGDIKRFASVLRVLLGCCIGNLCKGTPDPKAEPVTFFLDELPRLKKMDVVEEALDVGRGFGVRLWMFAQNIGQLKTSYPNAEGMVGNCLAQCYMNPDSERAKWLSEHLGIRRGLLDGNERPLVEASDLTGHDYADKIVVMLNGMDNAVLTKRPYYSDPIAYDRATKANTPPSSVAEPAE